MAARRGRPPLDPVDRALWEAVAATVTPLRQRRRRIVAKPAELPLAEPPKPAPTEAPKPDAAAAPAKPAPARGRPVAPPPKPAPGDIDRRTRLRIARGHTAVEARIDLHGLTQARAHAVLLGFLASKQAEGLKTVLVITGKGRPGDAERHSDGERGVLRRLVPAWLGARDAASLVESYGEAAPPHGGGGALYVRLRRRGRVTG
ncbi:Smr/MutS family protein [Pseudoxanthobacter sp. M-2]|uniref:Smr/MutS family protein n=1 Tax=Pseudoxanthobacter sp. M-2 TaxID=3078754 RepID=UPI0038FC9834